MRATLKSPFPMRLVPRAFQSARLFLCALCALCGFSKAAELNATNFLAQAESAYRAAQAAYATNTQNVSAAIDLARTAFDNADLAKTDDQRETLANIGIAATRNASALNTNSVDAHYYLALNLGQLARTKMLGALKILTEMEQALKRALALDPKFDYAGGHRTIGVLYLEAPGWPTSVGNKNKARAHLTQALALAPEFPDNHHCYLEALAKWREWAALHEKIAAYHALLPAAKTNFTGPEWDYEWFDWTRRFKEIQTKAKKP